MANMATRTWRRLTAPEAKLVTVVVTVRSSFGGVWLYLGDEDRTFSVKLTPETIAEIASAAITRRDG